MADEITASGGTPPAAGAAEGTEIPAKVKKLVEGGGKMTGLEVHALPKVLPKKI